MTLGTEVPSLGAACHIALVLKVLDLGKICQDLVQGLLSKPEVRDDTLL